MNDRETMDAPVSESEAGTTAQDEGPLKDTGMDARENKATGGQRGRGTMVTDTTGETMSAQGQQARTKREILDMNQGSIKPAARYIFGPVARGGEPDVSDGEGLQFITASEQGMMWPREYSGAHFIETLNVKTFDDYVMKNPERIKPGRRLFFVEKDGGSQRLVFSGTVWPTTTTARLSDAAPVQVAAAAPPVPATDIRPTRAGYDELLEGLREDIRMVRQENTTLMTTISTLQTKLLEAERQRLAAEAARDAAAERHERDLAALRTQHADALAMMKTLHEKDMEVMAVKATDEAHTAYAEQLQDMDEAPSSFDRTMETLSDLAPVLTPVVTQMTQALTEYLMDHIEERRARRRQRRGELPAPQDETPAPAAPAVRPESQRRTPAAPLPDAMDANDIFPTAMK